MATMTEFIAGHCTHAACMAVRGAGLQSCAFPAKTYLLSANQRHWLWDTGYAQHFMDATASGLFALYRRVTPVYFESSQAIVSQLRQRGIQARDLSGVILSHFHGDHIAGLKDFPDVPLIASGQGWAQTQYLRGWRALQKGFVPELMPSDAAQRLWPMESGEVVALPPELYPFTTGYAVPGSNKELILVDLPGHAAGHIGAFVCTDDGWHLLAADAAWDVANFREGRLPSPLTRLIMADHGQYVATLGQLRLLDAGGQVQIHLSHDGGV
ncbi:MAG: MBL fold metallo-hydrolase [Neisseriaceae bacterium]|nr:MBL fold metallo-hydrolase [Neisseriaceae bacterium]